jgi:hypothetical protein
MPIGLAGCGVCMKFSLKSVTAIRSVFIILSYYNLSYNLSYNNLAGLDPTGPDVDPTCVPRRARHAGGAPPPPPGHVLCTVLSSVRED